MSTTVRISKATRDRVAALSHVTGVNMAQVIGEAVAAYERHVFWRAFEEGYEQIAEDPAARAGVKAERDGEAPALPDGLR